MAAMKIQRLVPRKLVHRDSSSVLMDSAYHQATCVMLRMTVETDLMNHIRPAVSSKQVL